MNRRDFQGLLLGFVFGLMASALLAFLVYVSQDTRPAFTPMEAYRAGFAAGEATAELRSDGWSSYIRHEDRVFYRFFIDSVDAFVYKGPVRRVSIEEFKDGLPNLPTAPDNTKKEEE